MNRDDCEKLLAAYRESVIAGNGQAAQPLFEVIVNIMADEKKPAYRGGGITGPNSPWAITVPTPLTKPIITCDGSGEVSVGTTARSATYDGSEEEL